MEYVIIADDLVIPENLSLLLKPIQNVLELLKNMFIAVDLAVYGDLSLFLKHF